MKCTLCIVEKQVAQDGILGYFYLFYHKENALEWSIPFGIVTVKINNKIKKNKKSGIKLDSKFREKWLLPPVQMGEVTAMKGEVVACDYNIFHSILKKNSYYAYYWH